MLAQVFCQHTCVLVVQLPDSLRAPYDKLQFDACLKTIVERAYHHVGVHRADLTVTYREGDLELGAPGAYSGLDSVFFHG